MLASVDTSRASRGRRVCIVVHKFDRGGSLRVAGYLAKGFVERGMIVDLIAFTSAGEVDDVILGIMGPDVRRHYLGTWRGPRPVDLVRGLPALAELLKNLRPDTIIAAANHVALVTTAARSLAGLDESELFLKTTNPIASSRHRGAVKWLRRWTYRKAFDRATGVWTLSRSENDEMLRAFPGHANLFRAVVNPYVTPAMLTAGASEATRVPENFILSIGRLTRQKRYDRMIKAFARIRDQRVRLVILGEGEERGRLTALVERLGLMTRVSLPGYVPDVASYLHQARLFVLTSSYEGLPAAILEAMAAECPVLSTDCFPAAREILGMAEGCAIFERPDIREIAAMIDKHLEHDRPRGLRAVAEHYSIENGVRSHVKAMAGAEAA